MASIKRIANASVTRETASLATPGKNIAAIAVYTAAFSERRREYTTADAVAVDFASSTHPARRAASAFFSITPCPEKFVVLRLANAPSKVFTVTPVAAALDFKIEVNGTEVNFAGGGTAKEIVEGLKALIDPLSVSGLTVTENDTVLTLTGSAGTYFTVEVTSGASDGQMSIAETTADPGIVADLDAIQAESKDWYGFDTEMHSKAVIELVAAWAESHEKAYVYTTQDSAVITNSSSDVLSALKTSSYDKSLGFYNQGTHYFANMALMAVLFAGTPGKRKAYHKALTGIPSSNLTDSQIGYLDGKNGTWLAVFGELNRTDGGKVASGEWFDIIHGCDYYAARLETDDASMALREPDGIGMDNEGIGRHVAVLSSIVEEMLQGRFARLDLETWPELGYGLAYPDANDISAADFASRTLNGVEAEVKLLGGIKKTNFALRLVGNS